MNWSKTKCVLTTVEKWETTKYFQQDWLDLMRHHQSNILPVGAIEMRKDIKVWFEFLPNKTHPVNSKYRCRLCTKYFDALKFDPRYRSALATKEEQLQDTYDKNQEIISKHSHTTMLQKFITVLQSRKQESIVEGFKEATERQNEETNDVFRVTALMFRLVFAEVMLNIPLASHPKLVDLMQQNGADMGYHHYDRRSTQRIVDFISNSMHRELLKTLNENSPDVSIILDGSTDPRQNHYLIVFLQAVEEYKPVVYFYRLIPLSMDETAEGLLKTLQESFEEDRLTKYMKEHLIGYAADGAAVMMGKHNGLAKKTI